MAGLQEKLDDLRVAVSRSSPMMEVVEKCLAQVGKEQLPLLLPNLLEVMKRGVGLGTRVAMAQFVVSLISQCGKDLTPFAGR